MTEDEALNALCDARCAEVSIPMDPVTFAPFYRYNWEEAKNLKRQTEIAAYFDEFGRRDPEEEARSLRDWALEADGRKAFEAAAAMRELADEVECGFYQDDWL